MDQRTHDEHCRSLDEALTWLDTIRSFGPYAEECADRINAEVEGLRRIKERAWTVATSGASDVIRDAALWIYHGRD